MPFQKCLLSTLRRLLSLNCRRKVLLTGTPIANSLIEMVSLLMFLMPRTFKRVSDRVMSLFESNSKDRSACTPCISLLALDSDSVSAALVMTLRLCATFTVWCGLSSSAASRAMCSSRWCLNGKLSSKSI